MEVREAILGRRSIRRYGGQEVSREKIGQILEAGRWAPSGLNNQPWRFAVVREKKDKMAELTRYSDVIKGADVCLAVFFDHESGYDRTKDLLAIGASIQNMLLSAYSLGIGTCWLGEMLNRKEDVHDLLGISGELELVAVIALGYPAESPQSRRREIEELVIDL